MHRPARLPALIDNTWGLERQGRVLLLRVAGYYREHHAEPTVQRALSLLGNDSLHLVGDLLDLERYDSRARLAWQQALSPIRAQVRSIRVVTSNRIVAMGVTVVAMCLGKTVSKLNSREDLLRYVEQHR